MIKKFLAAIVGLIFGLSLGYFLLSFKNGTVILRIESYFAPSRPVVFGFLPYWLLKTAKQDYSGEINTLSYFSLTIDRDGTILKLSNPQEEEPGYSALKNGKLDQSFEDARKKKVPLSLAVFNGDEDLIANLIDKPEESAKNLIADIEPLMKNYSFADLNLDVESSVDASAETRTKFTRFVREVKKGMDERKLGKLTVDITANSFVRDKLINPKEIAEIVDRVVIMAYDYHFAGSYVTGPVAPLYGAGTIAEFDIDSAVQAALKMMPKSKIVLGVPLYGYEWETIGNVPRVGIIPGTGVTASSRRIEEFMKSCNTCQIKTDDVAKEAYIIYKDDAKNVYHQIFIPTSEAIKEKINYAKKFSLGGIALWALGYENQTILEPLKKYN